MSHLPLLERAKELERDIFTCFRENMERIALIDGIDLNKEDVPLLDTILYQGNEYITHVKKDLRLFVDHWLAPEESRYIHFNDLTQTQQLCVIIELERILSIEDL